MGEIEKEDWELTPGSGKMENAGDLVKSDFSRVRVNSWLEWLNERKVGDTVMRMSIRQCFGGLMYERKLGNRDHSYTGDMVIISIFYDMKY